MMEAGIEWSKDVGDKKAHVVTDPSPKDNDLSANVTTGNRTKQESNVTTIPKLRSIFPKSSNIVSYQIDFSKEYKDNPEDASSSTAANQAAVPVESAIATTAKKNGAQLLQLLSRAIVFIDQTKTYGWILDRENCDI